MIYYPRETTIINNIHDKINLKIMFREVKYMIYDCYDDEMEMLYDNGHNECGDSYVDDLAYYHTHDLDVLNEWYDKLLRTPIGKSIVIMPKFEGYSGTY